MTTLIEKTKLRRNAYCQICYLKNIVLTPTVKVEISVKTKKMYEIY